MNVADPMVLAIRKGDPRSFGFPVYATPALDITEMPIYTDDDLTPFVTRQRLVMLDLSFGC
jgi:hypothetical protein